MDLPEIINHLNRDNITLFPTEYGKSPAARSKVNYRKADVDAFLLDDKGGYIQKERPALAMGGKNICDYLFLPAYKSDASHKSFFLLEITNLFWSFVDHKKSGELQKSFNKKHAKEICRKWYYTLKVFYLLEQQQANMLESPSSWLYNLLSNIKGEEYARIDSSNYSSCTFMVIVPSKIDAEIQGHKGWSSRIYANLNSQTTERIRKIAQRLNTDINMLNLSYLINGSVINVYGTLEKEIKKVSASLITAPHRNVL